MASLTLREIAYAGIIAAVYAVLALVFLPISFGVYQIRIAEALTILPFVTRASIPGLFIGCMLANVFGGLGWHDIVLGSLITLAAAFVTRGVHYLSRNLFYCFIAAVPAALLWISGAILLNKSGISWPVAGLLVISVIGEVSAARLMFRSSHRRSLVVILRVVSLIVLAVAVFLSALREMCLVLLLGGASLVAGWLITWMLAVIWFRGENPNVLIAPLPPVLFNAFGVSLYLAPLIGVNYWFSVQMVGIGQLIACYLLGLPLLRVLQNRKVFSQ